ncbi:MAG TPA: dienelactone hydrolase family protein, partial [Gemmatimonadaceae bacterium]|nr:dienelactone hydrolase family protein [Gemmatimonadaceae bacterium]
MPLAHQSSTPWWRAVVLGLALLVACDDTSTAPDGGQPGRTDVLAHLVVTGNPEAAQGASFTYRDTVDGVVYDLTGVLLKPTGQGPFPGVIVSHGFGGTAAGYSRSVGTRIVPWGVVVIAVNYTHAVGVPLGAPGTQSELGASAANVRRARRAAAILGALGYVDTTRLAAHGHSMGAFVTAGLAAAHPALLRAASHTAGGVRVDFPTGAAPTETEARSIRTPYQLHHGDHDAVVVLAADQRLATVLA